MLLQKGNVQCYTAIKNKMIMIVCTAPFVTIEVRKPISEPIPVRMDCFKPLLVTISSAITAPAKGPINIPKPGITKGPINRPIVLPHTPAFEPPKRFTPNALLSISAPNRRRRNITSAVQNHHGRLNVKNTPYNKNPPKMKSADGIIG